MRKSAYFYSHTRTRKGFSLIELLVVIAVIGLLAMLAVIQFGFAREKAKALNILADFKSIESGLLLYMQEEGRSTWWTESELIGAGSNNFRDIVATNPLLQKYLPVVPVQDDISDYIYDNDGDTYDPDQDGCGSWNAGVGIYAVYTNEKVIAQLDDIIDEGDGSNCGKLTFNANAVLYKLANDAFSSSF